MVQNRQLAKTREKYSLRKLAERWKCELEEVVEAIVDGDLRCWVNLRNEWCELQDRRREKLNGLYRLPLDEAAGIVTGRRQRELGEAEKRRSDKAAMLAHGQKSARDWFDRRFLNIEVLQASMTSVIVEEPDKVATVQFLPTRDDLRVLRKEVERFERERPQDDVAPVTRITTGEIATRFKVSESTARRWMKAGLPVRRMAENSLLGNWDEIQDWVQRKSVSLSAFERA